MAEFDSLVDNSAKTIPATQQQASPTNQDFDSLKDDSEAYSGAGQTMAAGLEGVFRGIAGPLAPAAEKLAGIPYKEQRGRQAAHPIASGVSEAGGLGAGFLTGTGEAALMGKAGEAAAGLAGLGNVAKEAPLIARIGSSAVKNAAEMAVLQGSDNVSKHIMNDPQAASESALANVGLAAAIGAGGGAFTAGVASPLWKATIGPKIESGLKALTSKLGGIEGQAMKSTADELVIKTGVEMPPAVKAVVNEEPGAMELHSILNQDDASIAGRSHQAVMNDYESKLAAKSIESLGKTPESIQNLPELDKYTTGRAQGEQLKSELQEMARPTVEGYNEFTNKYENSPLSPTRKQYLAEQIGQKAIDQGWHKAQDSSAYDLALKVSKDLDKQDSIVDLKKYITNLRNDNPYGKETYGAARDIGKILNNNLEDSISENIMKAGGSSEKALQEVSQYGQLRKNYANLMSHLGDLDEYLKVGRWHGPESFFNALEDMSIQHGERIADRLSGKGNANVLDVLKQTPQTLDKVKQYHIDKLLTDAVQKAPPGKAINTRVIADTISNPNKMQPQIRDLITSPEQQNTIQSINQVMDALRDPNHNFSNTARTLGKQSYGSVSPISLIAMLMGHGEAGILSWLGSLGFSEARPALRLGMLKFLGSDAPVKSKGFKSMVSMIDSSYKGGNSLTKAAKAMFQPGLKVLSEKQLPTSAEIAKLDKLVAKHQEDPNLTIANAENQHIGHYMPEHQQALIQTQTNALQYLSSVKPKPYKPSPLDNEIPPTKAQEARYDRALTIAQNPLIVLNHAKEGTLQVSDLQDLKAMYPKYMGIITNEVVDEMISRQANQEPIPYKTRMGVSLLVGQALDTSMQPASIIAAQPLPKAPQQPQQGAKTKRGTSTLGKSNASYRTPQQAAEADRSGRE